MRITPMMLLHWLLVTAAMVLSVRYIGGEVIGWQNIRPFGGRGSLYGMASNTLLVVFMGWLLVACCAYAAGQDGEYSLEGIVLTGIGWFLLLIVPIGIYVSRL